MFNMEEAMCSKLNQRLVAFALVSLTFGLLDLTVPAAQAQSAACTAFADADFRGKDLPSPSGKDYNDTKNEKISSFKILQNCRVVAYDRPQFQGASVTWNSSLRLVGADWKDRISSWKCLCAMRID